ncbi:TIGR03905 family TSCPD domain-containing protein [Ruminococcaceae bacterium OttesenSCG-928-I18]|nr:TIGR03905 family TSCPD domain-containing protein [Ruminococcaceae bacterium OttesenSCG-928-I18]
MVYKRKNAGVCSFYTTVRIEEGRIEEVSVLGGCDGNLKGICALLRGRKAEEAADLLRGIRCENKRTSCPNEMSKCIEEALALSKKAS